MRKLWKSVVPVMVLSVGFWIGARPSYAKPEYSKKEKKGCTYCHVGTAKKELNEAGKYYKEHDHSLDGYTPAK